MAKRVATSANAVAKPSAPSSGSVKSARSHSTRMKKSWSSASWC